MKIPRKKKKKIPVGFYCYTFNGKTGYNKEGLPYYGIDLCPFYQHKEGIDGYCSVVKYEVDDQVKVCGIKRGTYK
jgi:hypothetical protein